MPSILMILDGEDSPLRIVIADFGTSNILLKRFIKALLARPFSGTAANLTFRISFSKLIISFLDDFGITLIFISIPYHHQTFFFEFTFLCYDILVTYIIQGMIEMVY